MDPWHYRTFVTSGHRQSHLAAQLFLRNLELLEQRSLSGEDTAVRAPLRTRERSVDDQPEQRGLAAHRHNVHRREPLGAHIRLRYFRGAQVPLPGSQPTESP